MIYEFLNGVIRREGRVWCFLEFYWRELSRLLSRIVSKCLYGSQIHLDIYPYLMCLLKLVAISAELKYIDLVYRVWLLTRRVARSSPVHGRRETRACERWVPSLAVCGCQKTGRERSRRIDR